MKLSSQEKTKLVIKFWQEKMSKSDFCAKYGISRSTFYCWEKVVLAQIAKAFTSSAA